MFINFWYPMALASEVTDKPVRSRALGLDFVLFRDAGGAVRCLANTCIHRGGSLGSGKLVDGQVQCPYHGWRFDGEGRCQHIPTLPADARIPARARVDAYPVEERYGVVFAFLGELPEGERPPIMDLAQWGREGWSVTSTVYDWNASFDRVIENGLDATHTEFVHPSAGLQGGFDPSAIRGQRLVTGPWSSACQMETDRVDIEHGHHGPSQQWTFLSFKMKGFTGKFRFYSFVRPIDAHSVRRYLFHARDCQHGEKMDADMVKTTLGFELEDRPVIEEMRPVFSPRDALTELLLPEDEIMMSYRRFLADWERRGWLIDDVALAERGRRKVFAVPGPGRRETRNWVLEPVPLVSPAA
jgi:phenylpropionate dioxygenase-like ring-hydroxylating dioxygenase large terminal subunit